MNKRKISIIVVIALILLVGTITIVSLNNSTDEKYTGENVVKNKYYKETETSISFNSKNAITETHEKVINVNPFQEAVITIDKNEILEKVEQYK